MLWCITSAFGNTTSEEKSQIGFLAQNPEVHKSNNSYQESPSWLLAENPIKQENHIKRRRKRRKEQKNLKPQYQNCRGKNIYQLDSKMRKKASLSETEAKGPCIDCALQEQKNQNIENLTQSLAHTKRISGVPNKSNSSLENTFKEKLQKRAIGLIQSKIAETERLKACMKGDRNWFAKRVP